MSDVAALRRYLYDQHAALGARRVRSRRALRKQIALLSKLPPDRPDGGAAGVREPRRPLPPHGSGTQELDPV